MPEVTLALVNGERFTVHVDERGGSFTVRYGEQVLSGEASLAAGEGMLRLASRLVPFYYARRDDELQLWIEGEVYRFTLPLEGRQRRGSTEALSLTGEVPAPMPGQVLKVLVEPGQAVAAQAPMVVMESMKMELTVAAPGAGRVAEVRCAPGQMVDMGAVLVRLESVG